MNNIANDVNGDFYVTGQQGELEEDKAHRYFIIPAAHAANFSFGTMVDRTAAWLNMAACVILRANYWFSRSLPDPPTHEQTTKIVWLRFLGLLLGLADIADNPAAHNLIYNDVKVREVGNLAAGAADTERRIPTIDVNGAPVEVHPYTADIPGWADAASQVWRVIVWKKFANIICMIAFFMRTRAHHFLDDMKERYQAVWRKCLYDEDEPGLDWQHIAHNALHYVYPKTLDDFWANAVSTERCAGALIKRFNSYPAGMAAVGATWAGYRDLIIIFPGFGKTVEEAVAELKRCAQALVANRWAGSVNRRYYGAPDVKVDEQVLAALASTIVSALKATGQTQHLANSKALQRVGQNAPITGAFMTNVITKASQHEDMVYAILPDDSAAAP